MGYRVAARVVSAAEVGGAHTRERLFILAHADVQARRQSRLHCRGPEGIQFKTDQNQTGTQIGVKTAATAWTLMWELMMAAGWTPQRFRSSHRFRVILLNGEKYSEHPLTLNPAFTDWMMGWPSGWTDPLQPVTGWCQWLRHARTLI